jgi:catechol 2,3-dioxygenase-like lactoylglutathione lyase family enzyme
MNRLHVHVAVSDLEKSIAFYSTLFDARPSVLKPDYAKWMLDDPRVNFAISQRGAASGVDHLGIQVESDADLGDVAQRLGAAGADVAEQHQASCCYAKSNKAWVKDPDGISWETFHTTGAATSYGEDTASKAARGAAKHSAAETPCCGAGVGAGKAACC